MDYAPACKTTTEYGWMSCAGMGCDTECCRAAASLGMSGLVDHSGRRAVLQGRKPVSMAHETTLWPWSKLVGPHRARSIWHRVVSPSLPCVAAFVLALNVP
mmetsp:Transcript_39511/g.125626  ORF Transcript_39511/g.125626 Transcript_39511/m.125626 type:complete len:101 (-) Transcript_39511:389-691(-)